MAKKQSKFTTSSLNETQRIANALYRGISNTSKFKKKKHITVGFIGEVGSGKTTLSQEFAKKIPSKIPIKTGDYGSLSYTSDEGLRVKRIDLLGLYIEGKDIEKALSTKDHDVLLVEHADQADPRIFDLLLTVHFTESGNPINLAYEEFIADNSKETWDSFIERRSKILDDTTRCVEINTYKKNSFDLKLFKNSL
jgi:tRNA A37 threonylcarbamoyladenosine biosynthesis protein TsaE